MSSLSSRKSVCLLISVVFFSFCPAHASEYLGSNRDLRRIESIKSNGEKYVSDHSILWIEKDYLSKKEAHFLQNKIDKAIKDIEEFTGIQFDVEAYQKEKIEYFVHSRGGSHTITGYQPGKYMFPVIFLGSAIDRKAPYVHETVHIIAWDWNSLWIKEGFAVYLNDKLDGYPAFPNYGKDIDRLAKSMLHFESALLKIGKNGVPEFSNKYERRAYYVLSGSFVKYLYSHIDLDDLMKIYEAKSTKQAVVDITGKKLEIWKNEWIGHLNSEISAIEDEVIVLDQDLQFRYNGKRSFSAKKGEELTILYSKPCKRLTGVECWAVLHEEYGKGFLRVNHDLLKK